MTVGQYQYHINIAAHSGHLHSISSNRRVEPVLAQLLLLSSLSTKVIYGDQREALKLTLHSAHRQRIISLVNNQQGFMAFSLTTSLVDIYKEYEG